MDWETWYGRDWLANRESVHTLTLSPPFAWDAHLAMELVESTQVKTVRSFTVTADEPDLEAWIDEDNDEPIRSLEAIEGTIKAKRITRSIISSLNKVHKYCVSPGGKEDYSSSVLFDFPFTLLWPTNPGSPIRNIYDSETPASESSTLSHPGGLARHIGELPHQHRTRQHHPGLLLPATQARLRLSPHPHPAAGQGHRQPPPTATALQPRPRLPIGAVHGHGQGAAAGRGGRRQDGRRPPIAAGGAVRTAALLSWRFSCRCTRQWGATAAHQVCVSQVP
mmetsp:Transcript_45271/g.127833  ORF Transcript_45271/g.127833 Transcript_45271/m.127833 type:complete len:279 (-) Transcript_45271:49-885(-)